jgi:hypothetical protein
MLQKDAREKGKKSEELPKLREVLQRRRSETEASEIESNE